MRVIIIDINPSAAECPKSPMEDLAERLRDEMRFGRGSRTQPEGRLLFGLFMADIHGPCVQDIDIPQPQASE